MCTSLCVTFKLPEAKLSTDFLTSCMIPFNHQKRKDNHEQMYCQKVQEVHTRKP